MIGSGGTSTVWLVTDRHIGKMLAMKVMSRRSVGALGFARSEIESMRRVRYPLVPRIMDAFCDDDNICILSEYIKGSSLASIGRKKGMKKEEALDIARRICEALIYLHEMKDPILYLDLKPENIIIDESGMPHLIDFGIAGLLARRHIAVGTAGYSPPEQYLTDQVMDARADIFAFGMTYWAVRSGIPPDPDPAQAFYDIRHSRILSSSERSFLKKCCALSKEDRFTCAREVLDQIRHIRSIPDRLKRTVVTVSVSAGLCISCLCAARQIETGISENEAASYLVKNATRYMKDGEYTPEGIGIIKACIKSGSLSEDCEQEFILEVAMNSMLVSRDYQTAASYFERLDRDRFPEVAEYLRLCRIQSRFDFDPKEAAYVTGRLFSDMISRAPSIMKYENLIFIANCFENYAPDPADGAAKALSVLDMTKQELDELINGGSSVDRNELVAMRERVISLMEVKRRRLMINRKMIGEKNGKIND